MQDVNKARDQTQGPSAPSSSTRPRFDIHELVGSYRTVTITHGGQDYVLRITRNGKLILTK
jgi:hemin uptake protein HemP